MANSAEFARLLRTSWLGSPTVPTTDDYWLIYKVGNSYAARTRTGLPAIVTPLGSIEGHTSGRRAAGCELSAIKSARFRFEDLEWEGAAAVLSCHDDEVVDAFLVLGADVIARIGATPSWQRILEIVEEWQQLLSSKGLPNPEGELGLWGELWFLASASDVPLLLASWRGPDGDATDFFLEGVSAEVKTSRQRRQHHISLTQVSTPVGDHEAHFLSIWVKEDPILGVTVSQLVASIESRCEDHGELHRRLHRAGYSRAAKSDYTKRFALLEEPEWYASSDIPTVRAADAGVTDIRFRVILDEARSIRAEHATALWTRFWNHDFERS